MCIDAVVSIAESQVVDEVVIVLIDAFLAEKQLHVRRVVIVNGVAHLVHFLEQTAGVKQQAVKVARLAGVSGALH